MSDTLSIDGDYFDDKCINMRFKSIIYDLRKKDEEKQKIIEELLARIYKLEEVQSIQASINNKYECEHVFNGGNELLKILPGLQNLVSKLNNEMWDARESIKKILEERITYLLNENIVLGKKFSLLEKLVIERYEENCDFGKRIGTLECFSHNQEKISGIDSRINKIEEWAKVQDALRKDIYFRFGEMQSWINRLEKFHEIQNDFDRKLDEISSRISPIELSHKNEKEHYNINFQEICESIGEISPYSGENNIGLGSLPENNKPIKLNFIDREKELEQAIRDLRSRIGILGESLSLLQEENNTLRKTSLPHKCPNCDFSGLIKLENAEEILRFKDRISYTSDGVAFISCPSCKGKSLVWTPSV